MLYDLIKPFVPIPHGSGGCAALQQGLRLTQLEFANFVKILLWGFLIHNHEVFTLLWLFNCMLASHFPERLSVGLITAVNKSGDKSDMSNYRGITRVRGRII